jgi:hypothetical protein
MDRTDRRRRSRSGQLLDALVWGTALGGASGAVLGDAVDGIGAGVGAVIGVVLCAPAEAIMRMTRGPGQMPPLWQRIAASALLMALLGALLGAIYGPGHAVLTAIACGALLGALGLRAAKLALGVLVGAVLGALLPGATAPAIVAAAVTIAYRGVAAIVYRGRPLVRIMAEEVPASELRYVVPFEARSRYVGADYVEQLAKLRGGSFVRNRPTSGSSPHSTTSRGRRSPPPR